MRKRKIVWLSLAVLFMILAVVSAVLSVRFGGNLNVLEKSSMVTGEQNRCLAYDEQSGILYVGTYTNKLLAFKDGKKLWEMEARGPFRKLILRPESGRLYAGNEDNHLYILNMADGTLLKDINVQRRIFDVAVNRKETEIVISAGTSTTNKCNIMFYDYEGEPTGELKYTTMISGIEYTPEEDGLVICTSSAEVLRIDREGTEEKKYNAKYELVDLITTKENEYLALCNDGTYQFLNRDLELIRMDRPRMEQGVRALRAGMDEEAGYIFIGTKEGFLHVMNKEGEQVYVTRLDNSITDMLQIGDDIYITGLGDFVYICHSDAFTLTAAAAVWKPVTDISKYICTVFALLCVLLAIPAVNRKTVRFIRTLIRFRTAYLLLLPTFLLLLLFNYTPVFIAFTRAFTNWSKTFNTFATIKWVGLDNFRLMFSEGYFLTGVGNLFLLMITGFIKVLTVPVLVAYLVWFMRSDRKKYLFRFLFVLPIVVPGVVSAMLWKQIYDPTIGLLNQLLQKIGLADLQRVWLGDERTAMWAIIFMGFPFVNALAFLVFYGGLLDIDASMLEAARADGAGRWITFWRIQLPQIFPQIKMILILTFIGVVQDFNAIFILTGGGPGTSTYVPGLELYYNATQFGRYGYACALGVVMFLFIMVLTILNMRSGKQERQGG